MFASKSYSRAELQNSEIAGGPQVKLVRCWQANHALGLSRRIPRLLEVMRRAELSVCKEIALAGWEEARGQAGVREGDA